MDELARQRAATYRFWRDDAAARPAGEWADLGGVQVHTTGLAPRQWNGAFVTGPCDLGRLVPEVAAWFAVRDKPWGLLVPAELDAVPPGLVHALDQPVMLRGLEALPALSVQARTDAPAADVALVQAEAFEDEYALTLAFVEPTLRPDAQPPQVTLTAYDRDQPVGCATVAAIGDVAGVFGVAVRPAWRRQGLGARLTAAALRWARGRGCDLAFLNPSEMAYGMYAALGFRDAEPFRIWVPD
ncbi:MAG: GNAT family N-acetyltransferase [Actinobacteria bacterium]|nr:GNAT family N-acetyltransferase [Actinomycetota bacterium]MCA1722282.1 GNAT family N-acetyltransferase [Actinomycetota bacterium]